MRLGLLPCNASSFLDTLTDPTQLRRPLKYDERLAAAALSDALDMVNSTTLSQLRSDGLQFWQVTANDSFTSLPQAQNLARGFTRARALAVQWFCSTAHRDNILRCDLDSIGTGLAKSDVDQKIYVSQIYGCSLTGLCKCDTAAPTPSPAPPAPAVQVAPPLPLPPKPLAEGPAPAPAPTQPPTVTPTPAPSLAETPTVMAAPSNSPAVEAPAIAPAPTPLPRAPVEEPAPALQPQPSPAQEPVPPPLPSPAPVPAVEGPTPTLTPPAAPLPAPETPAPATPPAVPVTVSPPFASASPPLSSPPSPPPPPPGPSLRILSCGPSTNRALSILSLPLPSVNAARLEVSGAPANSQIYLVRGAALAQPGAPSYRVSTSGCGVVDSGFAPQSVGVLASATSSSGGGLGGGGSVQVVDWFLGFEDCAGLYRAIVKAPGANVCTITAPIQVRPAGAPLK